MQKGPKARDQARRKAPGADRGASRNAGKGHARQGGHGAFESEIAAYCVAQDTFCFGMLKAGRVCRQRRSIPTAKVASPSSTKCHSPARSVRSTVCKGLPFSIRATVSELRRAQRIVSPIPKLWLGHVRGPSTQRAERRAFGDQPCAAR